MGKRGSRVQVMLGINDAVPIKRFLHMRWKTPLSPAPGPEGSIPAPEMREYAV